MKKLIISLILLFLYAFSFGGTGFLHDIVLQKNSNTKTLLIFYKPDCPYCINMDKAISADAVFQKQLTGIFNVQIFDITTTEGRLMADKFNVHAVPTVVQFNNLSGESIITKGFGGIVKLSNQLGITNKVISSKKEIQNTNAACGDGVVDGGEQCDDGNVTNGDGCSSTCTVQTGYTCTGNPSICATTCGDGVTAGAEQCDDGNLVNGDGCNNTCLLENLPNDDCAGAITLSGTSGDAAGQNITATISAGVPSGACQGSPVADVWYKFTLASQKLCSFSLNGPSIQDPFLSIYSGTCGALVSVICDDDSGPGLYSFIQTPLNAGSYFIRVSHFSATSPGTFNLIYNINLSNICGNNIIENTEECDDGNTTNGDGCNSICNIENAGSITGVAINNDATRANPSAMLEVKSFDKGMLVPRMNSTQRTAIATPAKGLLVFDITTNTFWFYSGSTWTEVGGTSGNAGSGLPVGTASQTLRNNGTNWIANSTLQNDGTNVTVANQLKIAGGSPAVGKVLTSDNTGLATWQTPAVGSSAFSVRLDSNRTLLQGGTEARLHFGNYGSGTGNYVSATGFNPTTDEFVAPTAGLYNFTIDILLTPLPTNDYNALTLFRVDNSVNTIISQVGFIDFAAAGTLTASHSHNAQFNLNVGDKVYITSSKFNSLSNSNVIVSNGSGGIATTRFMGYKIN